jgi:hypothetical protein
MSLSIAFLLSPKDGLLTTHTLRPALTLLIIREANGYDSISSAIIKRGLFFSKEYSKNFKISSKEVIFPYDNRIKGFSKLTFCSLASVKKYGLI